MERSSSAASAAHVREIAQMAERMQQMRSAMLELQAARQQDIVVLWEEAKQEIAREHAAGQQMLAHVQQAALDQLSAASGPEANFHVPASQKTQFFYIEPHKTPVDMPTSTHTVTASAKTDVPLLVVPVGGAGGGG